MPFTIDWNGNITSSADSSALWSTKGGVFTSKSGIKTYFPLPQSLAANIPTVGVYTITAATQDRADLIAKELYQNEEYWWLVYWINGIIDPFTSLKAGTKLLIADLNVIKSMVR